MKTSVIRFFTVVLAATPLLLRADPFGTNLLTNPGAEIGDMSGWSVFANGGDGWGVITGTASEGTNYFATSHEWDIRSQTVDLLAAGFSDSVLDAAPDIRVGVDINAYWGGSYYLSFRLEDISHNVIASYSNGSQSSPITLPTEYNTSWTNVGTLFSGYGSGVRYVVYEDGGRDVLEWMGQFGISFDAAEVSVVPEPSSAAFFIVGLLSGGLVWRCMRRRGV